MAGVQLDGKFLRSKVARRVFALFVLCALLPISVLAGLSYHHVTRELTQQSQQRLYRASKAVGMGVYERLLLLDAELKLFARGLRDSPKTDSLTDGVADDLAQRFEGIGLREGRRLTTIFGRLGHAPALSGAQLAHVRQGKSLVLPQSRGGSLSRLFMLRRVGEGDGPGKVLVAELTPAYLWGIGEHNTLPAQMEMCVLDERGRIHVCSAREGLSLAPELWTALTGTSPRSFEWEHDGRGYLASFWPIPLRLRFGVPTWTVVLSEPKAVALAPLANFRYTFPLVILLAVWVVVLLSLVHIRRSLVPLERLQEGTRRVANRDFSRPVLIESHDEFAELAHSFNTMASRLGRQFRSLATMREIDRVMLSSLDTGRVIDTVLTRMPDLMPCDLAGVVLRDPTVPQAGWMSYKACIPSEAATVEAVEMTLDTLQDFHQHPDSLVMDEERRPEALAPLLKRGSRCVLVLPLFRGDWVLGYIALGYRQPRSFQADEVAEVRQVADQVAVALSNAEDVAARARAEELLRESHQRLERALEDLRTTQAQMIQQERLRALGQMASGIAHDFNNTLSPIIGFSELLLLNPDRLADPEKAREHLHIIHAAARDAGKVVSHLRDLYRPPARRDTLEAVDLTRLVEQTITMTKPRWRDQALTNGITIQMETNLQETPLVAGDESELREVLTNLIFNAVDALEQDGTLTIRTYAADGMAVLEVEDTGIGMSEEVRQRALEPFFSTKGERGTGLGLSMVHGIIRRYQGTIDIRSRPGNGTCIHIRLPIQTADLPSRSVEDAEIWPHARVLVVDDNELVGRVTAEYLGNLGYTTATAGSGQEALEKLASEGFDLVITDQGMPGMSGEKLAREIKRRSPSLPVVLLTGVGRLTAPEVAASDAIDEVVHKPLTMLALRQALARIKAGAAKVRGQAVG